MDEGQIRTALIDEILMDLVGPKGGETEVLKENPARSYLSGILFPQESMLDDDYTDATSVADASADPGNEDPHEERYGHNMGVKPASFGLTCTVSKNADRVTVRVDYGIYLQERDNGKPLFRRVPQSHTFDISLNGDDTGSESFPANPKIILRYFVRRRLRDCTLSVFVVNEHAPSGRDDAEACVFQPTITLTAPDGPAFVDSRPVPDSGDLDENLFEMLFREKRSFAVGHGCAVEWDENDESGGAVSRLRTTFIPMHVVPGVGPRHIDMDCLYMEKLYQISHHSEYAALLSPITDAYERWISDELESKADTMPQEFRDAAARQICECRKALKRMRRGIYIISHDKIAGEAFAFANRAMRLQLSYGVWAQENVKAGKVRGYEPDLLHSRWRAFQLAFILLNIESITDPASKDRKTADLLWFATAGGKTEAYLGLVAFAISHRRLRNESIEHLRYGTSVLIRYTLRLLTLQQLQRIARLMCACEFIRRRDQEKWGDEPFLVGLWVGLKTTPNTLDGESGAAKAIEQAKWGNFARENNPIQLVSCVWCGAKIGAYEYDVGGDIEQCRIYCSNRSCEFAKRTENMETNLPILVVDEDIYKRCPAVVIGTVDKFARMAWKWETGAIFGRVTKYCQKHGFVVGGLVDKCGNHRDKQSFVFADHGPPRLEPPELIIQDELHLISGPLGTLTGLYETAIDMLCTNEDGILPKVIASTATAKKAAGQILALFNRADSSIFPPQGFTFGESFFSEVVPKERDPGRIYLGVTTPINNMQVLGRVSAAILGRVRVLRDGGLDPSKLDKYYTLAAYFNRIKELGIASVMYNENVPGHIKRIRNSHGKSGAVEPLDIRELTGQVDSSGIPKILQELEVPLGGTMQPVDILLCTNMLSVGVDIPRLGVMVINGQPKSHSEYIQASGRIGRDSPGLVVINYNYLKPRDLSHYESFQHYHMTLHKHVESVSLTPFSSRARDKALFGVLISLVRLLEERLAKNNNAKGFDTQVDYVRSLQSRIRDQISRRVEAIDGSEREGTLEDLDGMIREWHRWAADSAAPLHYTTHRYRKQETARYLMTSLESPSDGCVPVPNSLRDAEGMVSLEYVSDLRLSRE